MTAYVATLAVELDAIGDAEARTLGQRLADMVFAPHFVSAVHCDVVAGSLVEPDVLEPEQAA